MCVLLHVHNYCDFIFFLDKILIQHVIDLVSNAFACEAEYEAKYIYTSTR